VHPLIFLGKSMCDIYTSADPIHYEQRTRSMRIRGVVTSIRLENLCWDILARIASKDQMTTNQLISKLYDEIIERQGRVDNLSSFLRVSCMRYLSYVAEQQEKDHLMMKQSALADAGQVRALPHRVQLKAAVGQSG
jgi:predicted DNA-binding ribbon-helix-helix protein